MDEQLFQTKLNELLQRINGMSTASKCVLELGNAAGVVKIAAVVVVFVVLQHTTHQSRASMKANSASCCSTMMIALQLFH